jgi:hypothetical protein
MTTKGAVVERDLCWVSTAAAGALRILCLKPLKTETHSAWVVVLLSQAHHRPCTVTRKVLIIILWRVEPQVHIVMEGILK